MVVKGSRNTSAEKLAFSLSLGIQKARDCWLSPRHPKKRVHREKQRQVCADLWLTAPSEPDMTFGRTKK